jgi:putative drug exporter of the RND superfamily
MKERLDTGTSRVTIVFAGDELDARGADFQELQKRALSKITPASVPGLRSVDTFASTGADDLVSPDGRASIALLEFDTELEDAQAQVPAIRRLLQPTALKTYISGEPAVYDDLQRLASHDLEVAEIYTLPIALFVLLLIFGTLVAAGLPVVGGGMAVTVTFGMLYLVAGVMDLSIFVMNSATMLGLAVGIDYSLFMVGRFREEMHKGRPVGEAVEITVTHAGRSIFFSGLAVVVGLAALLTFRNMALRSVGVGGVAVVSVSVLAALTLLPALLGMLGPRVDSLRVFGRREGEGRFWWRWSRGVMGHPVPILVGTVAVVLLLAWPALHLAVDVPTAQMLPTSAESRQGWDLLQARFDPSLIAPIEVVLTWDGVGDPDPFAPANIERAFAFGEELAGVPGVKKVRSVVNLPGVTSPQQVEEFWSRAAAGQGTALPDASSGGRIDEVLRQRAMALARRLAAMSTAPDTIHYQVLTEPLPTSHDGRAVAERIEKLTPPPGTKVYVGGIPVGVRDYVRDVSRYSVPTVAFVLCVTYVVLLIMLRSVLLPLKAVAVNLLSVLAAYGALVFVFQWGHGDWLFGFASTGAIGADLPLLMFCGIFGISMDYEVFLLTRMREEWLRSHDHQHSVAFGLATTGRIVTSAALIIVVVAGSFAFTSIVYTKAMGVGLAVAVGLDATVIRILMVPAVMRLIGPRCWWMPGWLDRWLPVVGEGEVPLLAKAKTVGKDVSGGRT